MNITSATVAKERSLPLFREATSISAVLPEVYEENRKTALRLAQTMIAQRNSVPLEAEAMLFSAMDATSKPLAIRPDSKVASQALQVAAQIRRRLVAKVAIFFQSLADDALKFGRNVRIKPRWLLRRAIHDCFQNYS